ncbi:hypothetical protein BBP17_23160 [Salmonella enterica subsp. enterica serovar Enteritidis]|nr:hypothetical protein BBP17_23160 [Salmonella enterica subsp. enterica serovar Enteritidis]
MAMNATLGKEGPGAGTEAPPGAHPPGGYAGFMGPRDGPYKHENYTPRATDRPPVVLNYRRRFWGGGKKRGPGAPATHRFVKGVFVGEGGARAEEGGFF